MIRLPEDVPLPLYQNDGKPLFIFNRTIKEAVKCVNEKISSGFYRHIENSCLCGNTEPTNDVLIARKDMWGISVDSVLCSCCGLIRSKSIPDDKALADFYETDYKNIYYNSQEPGEAFFSSEENRGAGFLELIKNEMILDKVTTVFDHGCGMGGALMPFMKAGKKVSGCDFGKDYIAFGDRKGLNLYQGVLDERQTPKYSQDLVIVSHVMEHFTDTVKTMQDIIEVIAPGKYLLVEVPGLYADHPYKYYPVWHLQKAHIVNFFYKDFLIEFFTALGLEIIFSNERCTLICKKPHVYQKIKNVSIRTDRLKEYPQKNLDYFILSYRSIDLIKWKNPVRIAKTMIKIADFLKLRFVLNLLFKDSKQWIS